MEEWRQHPYIPIEVSSEGQVRQEGIKVTPYLAKTGYLAKSFRGCGKHPRMFHVLVLETFRGLRPFPRAHSRHLNGVPTDNRLTNLAWGTAQENAQDCVRHDTVAHGERTPACKYTNAQVEHMRALRVAGATLKTLSTVFGCSESTASQITRGRSRRYQGGEVLDQHVKHAPSYRPPSGPRSPQRDAEIISLAQQGLNGPEIATRLGLTRQRIGQVCRAAGFHLPRSRAQ